MEHQKVNFEKEKEGKEEEKEPHRGQKWCVNGLKKRRSLSFKKKKFVDGWKRKVKANIGKHQEQWHSHMSELNERRHKFGLVARDHNIGNEHMNCSE